MKYSIYEPLEDSYFFKDFLIKYLSKNSIKSHLDVGTGSGILAKASSKIIGKEFVLATDINESAIENLKGVKGVVSNLFENINGKFDLITFNAPYLPLDKREPKDSKIATTGGIKGDEISLKFLKAAKKHLTKNGRILLLISSLTPFNKIEKYSPVIVARKKLFNEVLLILEFME